MLELDKQYPQYQLARHKGYPTKLHYELIAQINPNAKIVCEAERLRPEKSEVNRLLGDSTKLRELTGWAPQYTFEQGLAATIEFLRGNLDQYKVGQYIL